MVYYNSPDMPVKPLLVFPHQQVEGITAGTFVSEFS
jgi:hypothetical protein